MFSCRWVIAVAALAALPMLASPVISPVLAQDAPNLKKDMVGQWELATTERSKTCVVTLKGDTTPQGLKPGTSRGWATSCGCRTPPASR